MKDRTYEGLCARKVTIELFIIYLLLLLFICYLQLGGQPVAGVGYTLYM